MFFDSNDWVTRGVVHNVAQNCALLQEVEKLSTGIQNLYLGSFFQGKSRHGQ